RSSSGTALDMVTTDGTMVQRRDGELAGAVVGLGAVGVVTHVTLQLVPTYDIAQYVYDDLPLDRPETTLDEAFAAGYSVSLFTDWAKPRANQVWVKCRVGDDTPPPARWLCATHAPTPRHPTRCTNQHIFPSHNG